MTRSTSAWRSLFGLFWRFARPHWPWLVTVVAAGSLAAVATSVQPLVLAPAIDTALLSRTPPAHSLAELNLNNLGPTILAWSGLRPSPGSIGVLAAIVGLYVLVVATAAALNYLTGHLVTRVRTLVARDLQLAMYRHLLSLSMPFFASRRIGELTSRFQVDAVRTADSLDPILRGVAESLLQLLIYGAILLKTDVTLAFLVGLLALSHAGITRLLQRQIRLRTLDAMDTYASVSAAVQESVLSIRVIKSFSSEAFEEKRFRRLLENLKSSMLRFSRFNSAELPLREIANAVVVAAALLVAFTALSNGRLTLPGFVMYVVVVRQATIPFTQLNAGLVHLYRTMGSAQRVWELLDTAPTLDDGAREAPALAAGIRLEQVSFRYPDGTEALREVSLEIPKGQVVALVGPSGAGKSTLADLVLRIHDPSAGRVAYDGSDVREFRQSSYRRRFGVVPQEPLLFNATIAENIAYGRAVDKAEAARAAAIANAEEFVEQLPQGYDTLVGDRGMRLSGGQRQRIALARAVYGRPDILVLDEATSSLDSESERLVQQAIEQALQGSTALVIAHRLSTVSRADAIVVLREGRVDAVGRHADLLQQSELYRRLYEAQFQKPARA